MMRTIGRGIWAVAIALMVIGVTMGATGRADAQGEVGAPVVALDHYELKPGDQVTLFIDGFQALAVTITVCGNEARRGSVDCNMTASEGRELDQGTGSTIATMPVAAPPVPCPCIIRVASRDQDEVATTPVTLIGHAVAPLVGSDAVALGNPLTVSLIAEPAPGGFFDSIRSSLGGATTYEVTLTVRNKSSVTVEDVRVDGWAGRNIEDQIINLLVPSPSEIGPNETWRSVVRAKLPAPVFGTVEWRATVSGTSAAAVTAVDSTSHRPILLIVLTIVLSVDVLVLALRLLTHRGRRRVAEAEAFDDEPDTDEPDTDESNDAARMSSSVHLVNAGSTGSGSREEP